MSQRDHGKIAFERGDFERARALFEEAAADGDAVAAHHFGTMCSRGQGGPKDPARAVALYRRAADAGVAEAAYNLGAAHALGHGTTQDLVEALRWYTVAAELGDRDALHRVGAMFAQGEGTRFDPTRAEAYWERATKLGDVPSMMLLGRVHEAGNPAKAMRWFLEAATAGEAPAVVAAKALLPQLTADAEAGNVEAQYYLGGAMMTLGLDRVEAARWFEAAAATNHPGAQRSLGFLYEAGQGVTKDLARAMTLYRAAAEAGDAVAQYNVGVFFTLGKGTSVDVEEGITWLRRAAEQGLGQAFVPLANRLTELDREEEARPWLARAAERGNAAALLHVGRWYRDGIGGHVDRVQAARWFMTAFVKHRNGDGIHEMHEMVGAMSEDELWEAARLSDGESVAASFLSLRGDE
jgi:TPR repeat protein